MFVGPVFGREAMIAPRRPRLYVLRGVYATALFILMCTAWLIVAGTQVIGTVGDMARFGAILFQILAPLQLTLILFLAAIQTAAAVAQEKDRKTFVLLLLTRMSNAELVLGRLFASLLQVTVLLAVSLPILTAVTLFGGVSLPQVFWVAAITAASAIAAGSLGSTLALWREKTFQTLASTIILIVGWIGLWEVIGSRLDAMGEPSGWVTWFSPARAVTFATRPMLGSLFPSELLGFVLFGFGISLALNALAIARVRVWNPGREVRPRMEEAETSEEAQSLPHAAAHRAPGKSRPVWRNPILWREMRTWAYGRKIVVIRVAYTLIAAAIVLGVLLTGDTQAIAMDEGAATIPPLARTLGPFFLASLVLINALAVTAITNERDVKALDLLLVTDLSPKEFLFGKLAGVLYVTRDMVVWPVIAAIAAWWSGAMELVPLIYLLLGLVVMNIFVAMLGIHCGSTYVSSRQAVAVSLGSVFFLFLGVLTCLYMMVSFGSFQGQLTPFLAFIVGGGVGLYVAWGRENPSPAILLTTGVLPLAMFFVITSFLLGRVTSVFLVMTATYGFATTAMMMPALGEYMVSMGRVRLQEDE